MQKLVKLMGITVALACTNVLAADPHANIATNGATDGRVTAGADNTGMNVRDRGDTTQTPQKQTNRPADRELLAAVRRAVVRDKTLSTSAHNVKIVATGGVVTLRGPVNNQEEKGKIEKLALQVAGVASVENQLDVKAK